MKFCRCVSKISNSQVMKIKDPINLIVYNSELYSSIYLVNLRYEIIKQHEASLIVKLEANECFKLRLIIMENI